MGKKDDTVGAILAIAAAIAIGAGIAALLSKMSEEERKRRR